jgi:hypothetical protein
LLLTPLGGDLLVYFLLRDLHKLAHHRITSSNRSKGSLAVVHRSLDRPKRQPWRLGWRRADNITNGDFIGATAGADERRRQAAAAPRLNTGPVPAHPAQKPSRKLAPSPTSSCSISSTRRVVRFTRQSRHSAGAGNESNTDRTVGTLSTPAPGRPDPRRQGAVALLVTPPSTRTSRPHSRCRAEANGCAPAAPRTAAESGARRVVGGDDGFRAATQGAGASHRLDAVRLNDADGLTASPIPVESESDRARQS